MSPAAATETATKIFGVVGWKNAGKTTLMARLLTEIAGRGVSVSAVKHAHHSFDVDHPGKDSWRHREAGAAQVLVSSRERWALTTELRGAPEPSLAELCAELAPVELILVEGFKRSPHPKIEAHRGPLEGSLIAESEPSVRGLAVDAQGGAAADHVRPEIARFDIDAAAAIADFVLARAALLTDVFQGRGLCGRSVGARASEGGR